MLKRVKLTMLSRRVGIAVSLFDGIKDIRALMCACRSPVVDDEGELVEPEETEMFCYGRLRMTEEEFSLTYDETELTGMEGTQSKVSFQLAQRGLITMLHTGGVSTALVFEEGQRHVCIYQTPIMPFEVCVHTLKVENRLGLDGAVGGALDLDYIVEIRGAQAEHCRMHLEVSEVE
ncbi:MAG: DUF1934 domain-containing protein [Clostridia bacterium]|nr:DUF1934 domain-containing protein [Clostridia bacterium]